MERKRPTNKKVQYNFRTNPAIVKKFTDVCKDKGFYISSVLEELMKTFISQYDKRWKE